MRWVCPLNEQTSGRRGVPSAGQSVSASASSTSLSASFIVSSQYSVSMYQSRNSCLVMQLTAAAAPGGDGGDGGGDERRLAGNGSGAVGGSGDGGDGGGDAGRRPLALGAPGAGMPKACRWSRSWRCSSAAFAAVRRASSSALSAAAAAACAVRVFGGVGGAELPTPARPLPPGGGAVERPAPAAGLAPSMCLIASSSARSRSAFTSSFFRLASSLAWCSACVRTRPLTAVSRVS